MIMKKILLVLALIITVAGIAQKNDVAPYEAKAAFSKAYSGAKNVKWEKENSNFEVSFTLNGQEASAIYDSKGTLLEFEQEMKVTDLPTVVTAYMKEHYKRDTVKGAAKITKAGGAVNYEAEIKGKDVIFDEKGKFIKEVKD
jgi:hypothetical protein